MFQLLILILALWGDRVSTAPLLEETNEEQKDVQNDTTTAIEDSLDQLLQDGLLGNDTGEENLRMIQKMFDVSKQKVCIRLSYTITYTKDQETPCDNPNITTLNCSDYSSVHLWVSFNPNVLAGRFLLHYAILDYKVLGLHWDRACDMRPVGTANLTISVPSLALLCGVADGERYVNESLQRFTEKVSFIPQILISARESSPSLYCNCCIYM